MTTPHAHEDDFIRFAEDDGQGALPSGVSPLRAWNILVVDDDEDVHQTTRFSLEGVQLFGRPLALLHATSAAQARDLLHTTRDVAVVLLDVVMETPDAGLGLVDHIRNTLQMMATRIVLRTGQPGYAPEHETLLRYDINDYKTKSELTHHKLLTAITTALRAYQQLCLIEASRRGLEQIVAASGELLRAAGIQRFASGVITQIAGILGTRPEGIVCARGQATGGYRVLAAAGQYAGLVGLPVERLQDQHVAALLEQALQSGQSVFTDHASVLFLGERQGDGMAAFVQSDARIQAMDVQLLRVFCTNLTACRNQLLTLERLHHVAYEDPMLKLPNRTRFIELLAQSLAHGDTNQALVLVDVDDFAGINDLMGHDYGDELLRAMAKRLAESAGSEVVLARVSGNAFGLLGPSDIVDPERILSFFVTPLQVAGKPHRVSVTLGACLLNDPGIDGVNWLKNASIALKQAKRDRRGRFVRFTPEMAQHARNRTQMLSELHAAFDHNHLYLAYQPQLDLRTGELIGLEALMRWRGHDGRMVPPDRFIPLAEQSGLIVGLGDWGLKTACLTMRELVQQGLAPRRMAVNVSVVQFQTPGFVERIQHALDTAGLRPDQLELEITESVSLLGHGVIETLLERLRAMGVSISIDDFGTGYSSLSYLERLPLDRIKIDKAFVTRMSAEGGPRIAELIAQLGQKLGLQVLAEGIEDAHAWRSLAAMGVHEGQGYHIARPLDVPELLEWLRQRPTDPRHYTQE
ncbi:putative bifunctional diguanylate cyclase/phosphodiesterase [Tepidicella baoligensis]|uniref:putative bifunctional diguanylate cyclase/phosphodiesterase n=1 Tax=Tepidicella baoligensis TaxID=2707016 RepID=UPI0015DB4C36|nr:EAL domain-containing protein [Tepidicella baoligensis]